MSTSLNATQESRFLPEATRAWLLRRWRNLVALALLAAGGLLITALVGFDPADPSLNAATDGPVANPLGPVGALAADLGLQSLGLSSALLAVVLMFWGGRLLSGRGLRHPLLRVAVLAPALVIAAGALAALSPPAAWPLDIGLGGFVGLLIIGPAAQIPALFGTGMDAEIAGGALGLVSLLAIAWALGLSLGEWKWMARKLLAAGRLSGIGLARLAGFGGRAVGRGVGAGVALARGRVGGGEGAEPRLLPPHADDLENMPEEDRSEDAEPPQADIAEQESKAPVRRSHRASARVEPPVIEPKRAKPKKATQGTLDLPGVGDYQMPPLALLEEPDADNGPRFDNAALEANARLLEGVLADFGVKGEIVKVRPGPVVTLYELEPAPGTKSSRVIGLSDDIARSMSAISVRVAVVPGRTVIGIELPNAKREIVLLREIFEADTFAKSKMKLPLTLGKDIGGSPVVADLAKMPHLLVAGTTGSGKSVAINTMILSLLYRHTPEQCRLIMVDPKMLELSVYDGIPHLLSPVVTDPKKAVMALKWTVREMENRYRNMSKLGVRNIEGYNSRLAEARKKGEVLKRRVQTGFDPETGKPVFEEEAMDLTPLPYIVVVVDEMADLMLVAGKEIEATIQRLAQMARAAGIHLIMATQRPSVDVITGTIKANFPTRISFQVTSKIDSRTILGEAGAETLLGMGDMLYMAGGGRITRVHGPFVSDGEVEEVVMHLKDQGDPDYVESVTEEDEENPISFPGLEGAETGSNSDSGDALFDKAVDLVARERKASTSFVQRHLQIGYNRAARLIERMEAEGMVSKANHVGKREVLLPPAREE
ncbi:MAG: DNA translocase FtsK 4TM domain-containing protein [Alphaproteobacteria bacterium]|nr:DNA translocase FtsK 4TM domain-containing protein [Alphaproteobacteria bacterium]